MNIFAGKYVLVAGLKITHLILILLALLVVYSIFINKISEMKKNEPQPHIQISQKTTEEGWINSNTNKNNATAQPTEIMAVFKSFRIGLLSAPIIVQ